MKSEFEDIESIERYLLGLMTSEEQAEFEVRVQNSEELKKNVDLQKELMNGVKQKAYLDTVRKVAQNYHFRKLLKVWGIAGLVLVTSGIMTFLYFNSIEESAKSRSAKPTPTLTIAEETPSFSEPVIENKEVKITNKKAEYFTLQTQIFILNNKRDTTIETQGGIVFVIPAECATGVNGELVEKVMYKIQEATTHSEIILAGLDTRSDGDLLETAGMFNIEAFSGNKELTLKLGKKILVQVPNKSEFKSDMKLFEGHKDKNENINWTNPIPLENFLLPVDILSLDFYPPNYISLLNGKGNKAYADSLYYSFSANTKPTKNWVDPASIKTIWNRKFNNTLLATKAFEERLHAIHKSCRGDIIELYVKNLDKNMYEIDLLAVNMLEGNFKQEFQKFANRKQGKLQHNNPNASSLAKYFELKTKAYKTILEKTHQEYEQKRKELDGEIKTKKLNQAQQDARRESLNFEKELSLNTKKVYKSLGINESAPSFFASNSNLSVSSSTPYIASIFSFGWKNIDRFIVESTSSKTSQTISKNGKSATITYETMSLSVDESSFDQTFVYLLPSELYSFMRVRKTSNVYSENLNAFIKYDLLCIGIKDKRKHVYSIKNVKAENIGTIKPKQIDENEFRKLVSNYDRTKPMKVGNDVEYQLEIILLEKKKALERMKTQELIRLKDHLFPCGWQKEELEEYIEPGKGKLEFTVPPAGLQDQLKKFGF